MKEMAKSLKLATFVFFFFQCYIYILLQAQNPKFGKINNLAKNNRIKYIWNKINNKKNAPTRIKLNLIYHFKFLKRNLIELKLKADAVKKLKIKSQALLVSIIAKHN